MTLSPPPAVTEADLLAYVDGRLGHHRRAEIEDHLACCPQDAGRVAADLALQEGLRLLFGRPARPPSPLPLFRSRRGGWLVRVAMAAGLVAVGFAAAIGAARLEAAPQSAAPVTAAPVTAAPHSAIIPASAPIR